MKHEPHTAHERHAGVETFYRVLTGDLSFGGYFTRFMVRAPLGNTIGRVVLVALINHHQVRAGKKTEHRIAPA